MVGAVAGDNLLAAGVHPGDLDGVLIGIGPGVGEEDLSEPCGEFLNQPLCQISFGLGGVGGAGIADFVQLVLHGLDDSGVGLADVAAHLVGGELQILLPVHVVHVQPIGPLKGQGMEVALGSPGKQVVFQVLLDDAITFFRHCHTPLQIFDCHRGVGLRGPPV